MQNLGEFPGQLRLSGLDSGALWCGNTLIDSLLGHHFCIISVQSPPNILENLLIFVTKPNYNIASSLWLDIY